MEYNRQDEEVLSPEFEALSVLFRCATFGNPTGQDAAYLTLSDALNERDSLKQEVADLKAEVKRLEQGEQGVNVEGLKELSADVGQQNYELKAEVERLREALTEIKECKYKGYYSVAGTKIRDIARSALSTGG